MDDAVVKRCLKSLIDNGMLPGDALRYVERRLLYAEMRAELYAEMQRRGIMPNKPNQDLPKTPPKGDPENPYTAPGESKAGRGGIVSPGGSQPKPSEDPRQDAGVAPPPAQPKK